MKRLAHVLEGGTQSREVGGAPPSLRLEMLRVLSWPLVALIALLVLCHPLKEMMKGAAQSLGRADTITVAGISMALSKDFVKQTPPEVFEVLGEMRASDIQALMKFRGTEGYFFRNPGRHDGTYSPEDFEALRQLKLVELVNIGNPPPPPLSEDDTENRTSEKWVMSKLGKQTHRVLRRITTLVVREIVADGG